MVKPPLGIMPKNIWESMRFIELGRAIKRYMEHKMEIPMEWVEEYNGFAKRIKR